jgi:histidine triad (HIT) family protein
VDCLFCKIAEKSLPAEIVFEDSDIIGFRDRNPQATTHILLIPKQHFSTLNDTSAAETALLGKMMLAAKHVANAEGLSDNGYRLVMNINQHGGQTVYHIHLHVLGGRPMTWPPG